MRGITVAKTKTWGGLIPNNILTSSMGSRSVAIFRIKMKQSL